MTITEHLCTERPADAEIASYVWDHEEEREEDFPTLRNRSKMAGSFAEFAAGLESESLA